MYQYETDFSYLPVFGRASSVYASLFSFVFFPRQPIRAKPLSAAAPVKITVGKRTTSASPLFRLSDQASVSVQAEKGGRCALGS